MFCLPLVFLPRVGLIAVGVLLVVFAVPASGADAARPNIIMIVADDLGYGDLGCFGSENIRTPNIDRLAAEGTRFTQAYAGSPVCSPSRGVLMTGLHTGHGRIRDNVPVVGGQLEPYAGGREGGIRISMEATDYTVAQMLRKAGYATGISGKWGLGEEGSAGTPNQHGFNEWLGYLNQNHAPYYYTDYLDENEGRRAIPENAGGQHVVYSNDLFSDFSSSFIHRHKDQPFFLYLPYTIPHNRMEVPVVGDYAKEPWPDDAKIYAAMITRLDGYVGRLLKDLDELGLADQTLVIFTSDNGPVKGPRCTILNSAGGLRGFKSDVYEGGIRIPLVARWPGHVPAGRTSSEPWMFADFFPTCAELAGVKAPEHLDGRSVVPLLTGRVESLGDRLFYWEFPRDRLWQAVRLGPWKGVRYGMDQPLELYDLSTDPTEAHNVAATHSAVVKEFESLLSANHVPSPHWPAN